MGVYCLLTIPMLFFGVNYSMGNILLFSLLSIVFGGILLTNWEIKKINERNKKNDIG